jgi:hypothetical protein
MIATASRPSRSREYHAGKTLPFLSSVLTVGNTACKPELTPDNSSKASCAEVTAFFPAILKGGDMVVLFAVPSFSERKAGRHSAARSSKIRQDKDVPRRVLATAQDATSLA